MNLNRREFLILTAMLAGGCTSPDADISSSPAAGQIVDAGAAVNYAKDGVYPAFRNQGFFIIRQGEKLFALSSICTHRKCRLEAETDRSFYCPCHGSTFDPSGHVTEGPARQNLPILATSVNESGRLLVTVPVL